MPPQSGYSPAELLMNCCLCSTLPIIPALIQPSIPDTAVLTQRKRSRRNILIVVIVLTAWTHWNQGTLCGYLTEGLVERWWTKLLQGHTILRPPVESWEWTGDISTPCPIQDHLMEPTQILVPLYLYLKIVCLKWSRESTGWLRFIHTRPTEDGCRSCIFITVRSPRSCQDPVQMSMYFMNPHGNEFVVEVW